MRNLPFVKSIRFDYKILYRDIKEKQRLQRAEKEIEAYIYIYENEPKAFYFENNINNEEYINALKWELQGLRINIDEYTKRINIFSEYYKPTTLG